MAYDRVARELGRPANKLNFDESGRPNFVVSKPDMVRDEQRCRCPTSFGAARDQRGRSSPRPAHTHAHTHVRAHALLLLQLERIQEHSMHDHSKDVVNSERVQKRLAELTGSKRDRASSPSAYQVHGHRGGPRLAFVPPSSGPQLSQQQRDNILAHDHHAPIAPEPAHHHHVFAHNQQAGTGAMPFSGVAYTRLAGTVPVPTAQPSSSAAAVAAASAHVSQQDVPPVYMTSDGYYVPVLQEEPTAGGVPTFESPKIITVASGAKFVVLPTASGEKRLLPLHLASTAGSGAMPGTSSRCIELATEPPHEAGSSSTTWSGDSAAGPYVGSSSPETVASVPSMPAASMPMKRPRMAAADTASDSRTAPSSTMSWGLATQQQIAQAVSAAHAAGGKGKLMASTAGAAPAAAMPTPIPSGELDSVTGVQPPTPAAIGQPLQLNISAPPASSPADIPAAATSSGVGRPDPIVAGIGNALGTTLHGQDSAGTGASPGNHKISQLLATPNLFNPLSPNPSYLAAGMFQPSSGMPAPTPYGKQDVWDVTPIAGDHGGMLSPSLGMWTGLALGSGGDSMASAVNHNGTPSSTAAFQHMPDVLSSLSSPVVSRHAHGGQR